jgi:acyl-CoA reductase-like NAD-dependent aldehyde dehydrogenase
VPRGAAGLTADRLRELARSGAESVLKQLRAEIIAIERTFPELAIPEKRRAVRDALQKARKRVRTMTAAERKAVSERMKKYWAERRKARAKIK